LGRADPAAAEGDEKQIEQAFKDAYLTLHRRIELFAALPVKNLDHIALRQHLDQIGSGAHDA
jgi:arsenate reductase